MIYARTTMAMDFVWSRPNKLGLYVDDEYKRFSAGTIVTLEDVVYTVVADPHFKCHVTWWHGYKPVPLHPLEALAATGLAP